MGEFETLEPNRSMSVRIAEQVVARIQSGEFGLGTRLPSETELAHQFGVSRPSVREALGALQFVGYIDSVSGCGSRVISVTPPLDPSATPAEVTLHGQTVLRLLDVLVSPPLRDTQNQAWADRELRPIWHGQHRETVGAIRDRDVRAAAESTWQHLASSARNALTVVARDPSVDARVIETFTAFLDEGPVASTTHLTDDLSPHAKGVPGVRFL